MIRDAEFESVELPDTAEAVYRAATGSDVLRMLNEMADEGGRRDEAHGARMDAIASPLVSELFDAAEDFGEYVMLLLYASAMMAMSAFGQMEVMAQLRDGAGGLLAEEG